MNVLRSYQNFQPFNETEAWSLFKIAAIAEAVGWTLLILGIVARDVFGAGHAPVAVAGRIHGMLFVAYIIAALATGPSLRWPLWRTLFAGLCSVPPYGSLIYEQLSARFRMRQQLRHLQGWAGYAVATRPRQNGILSV
jgi:integral membrane protein